MRHTIDQLITLYQQATNAQAFDDRKAARIEVVKHLFPDIFKIGLHYIAGDELTTRELVKLHNWRARESEWLLDNTLTANVALMVGYAHSIDAIPAYDTSTPECIKRAMRPMLANDLAMDGHPALLTGHEHEPLEAPEPVNGLPTRGVTSTAQAKPMSVKHAQTERLNQRIAELAQA